ncbi:hypothetical protein GSI_04100 [Ganoderma sinense ZZ0214-1]|uniref:Uncharacterized protein n=1 Tax=Ganoderma sinense ZZ0214-1 TaxID=1077348 RepID=A0A2G8SID4_9APHY|nr:hypothetical protein GSI_04100 [Ganoderma sinense ZZ0214-1]
MSSLQAPPSLQVPAPPGPATRDLPSPPLDEDLDRFDRFVNEIRSPQCQYHLDRATGIINKFLLLLRSISLPIVHCIDLDDYFRTVFRFLSEKHEDERVSPRTLRKFWEDYSLSSRETAFENACEDLRLAEEEHWRVHEEHKMVLLTLKGRGFTVEDEESKATVHAVDRTVKAIQDCFEDCELAAKKRRWGFPVGVHLDVPMPPI